MITKKKIELVYPELSYQIVGVLFDVFNELGYGYQEKTYQRAIAGAFRERGIGFREQLSMPLEFSGGNIGRFYLDFLVENKVVLELKRGNHFLKTNILQVYGYLKKFDMKLGIIANYTNTGLKFKRIVNIR
jgi:GxxExxY protein